jgi:tetratricopeptide (TPR) repeat protein
MEAEKTPSDLRALHYDLLISTEKDYVQRAMRLGLAAIRVGQEAFAARVFDQAIRRVESLQEGAEQAERTKSKFVPEEEKWFKGEAYERAALYLYRGLLYLAAGDYGNAAACGKRVQLMDISSQEETQGDWFSGEWLLAYASLWQDDPATAEAALARADKFPSKQGDVPPPLAAHNLLIIAEAGSAPIKVRRGNYGEQLVIVEGACRTKKLIVQAAQQSAVETAAVENFYHQASTRGERKVDHFLKGKASFKATTDTLGNVGIVAGAGTLATSQSDTQSLVGLGVLLAGLAGKGIAASSTPEADIRAWDNLPQAVFFCALPIAPGAISITVKGLDYQGATTLETTKELTINSQSKIQTLWIKLP